MTAGGGTVANTATRSLSKCYAFEPGNVTRQLAVGDGASSAPCKLNEYGRLTVNDTNFAVANVTYVAGVATATSGVLDAGKSGVGEIASDWFGLIVTIAVLALVLGLTIAGFAYFGNRR